MKRILLITTGGTIACTETPQGLVPTLKGADLLGALPKTYKAQVECLDLFLIDSSLMEDSHRLTLAKTIWREKEGYDGFVVTHGTDTLAYTAAFLAHALSSFTKPVLLTGSQRPLVAKNSDGEKNLLGALLAAKEGSGGVYVFSYDRIISAEMATKISTEDNRAFTSAAAEYGFCHHNHGAERFVDTFEKNVAVVTVQPALSTKDILYFRNHKAVLALLYGAGGMGKNQREAFEQIAAEGVHVYVKSQCVFGSVSGDYAAHGGTEQFTPKNDCSIEYALYDMMFEVKR